VEADLDHERCTIHLDTVSSAIAAHLCAAPGQERHDAQSLGTTGTAPGQSQATRARLRRDLPQPRGLRGLGDGLHARHGRGGRRRLGAAVAPPLRARAPASGEACVPAGGLAHDDRLPQSRGEKERQKSPLPCSHDDSKPVSDAAKSPVAGPRAWTHKIGPHANTIMQTWSTPAAAPVRRAAEGTGNCDAHDGTACKHDHADMERPSRGTCETRG
jgi:hypothetical protein